MRRSVLTLGLVSLTVLVLFTGCNLKFGEKQPTAPDDGSSTAQVSPTQFVNFKWVSFTPTGYDPNHDLIPSTTSINGDLFLLKQTGFTAISISTSRQGFEMIPEMAKANGFDCVIMGIYNPADVDEINRAITAAPYVDAYAIGHCGLGVDYSIDDIRMAVTRLRTTGRAITIWEKSTDYNSPFNELCTFFAPVVHPYEDGRTTPVSAANYAVQEFINVASLDPSRTTMLFGVGYPTAGGDFTNGEMQMIFYQNIPTDFPWCFEEAFDQPWRSVPTQQHYGLFDQFRNPKMFISNNPFGEG